MNESYRSKLPHARFPSDPEGQWEALAGHWQMREFAAYRERNRNHPHVPGYHFYAPDGMLNDPNGLCFWRGRYHLFYQQYPPMDPRQHWGHAVSEDMVHWQDLPTAIFPDIEKAVFSGAALVEEDRVVAMYHGLEVGNIVATASDPLLLNWEKLGGRPAIPHPPADIDGSGRPYRVYDPFIWRGAEGYYSLSGSYRGPWDTRVMAQYLFFSQNLTDWVFLGDMMEPNTFVRSGNDGACPYFLPFGDKHILLFFSHATGAHCLVGTYDETAHRFAPEEQLQLCFGPVGRGSLNAPCAMADGDGGVYVIYNTHDAYAKAGHERAGAMTIMRHMRLVEGRGIVIEPAEQIDALRGARHDLGAFTLAPFEERLLPYEGASYELEGQVDLMEARALSIRVLRSADAREYTTITFTISEDEYGKDAHAVIDTSNSSLLPDNTGRIPEISPIPLRDGRRMRFRIFVDKCMIEVFVNDRALFQYAYPSLEDSRRVSVTAIGRAVRIERLALWELPCIL